MNLDKRLNAVLEMLSPDDIVADIGCDHGYLGVSAILKGIPFVQFVDNKEGPLSKAKENLNKYMISSGKYSLSCSSGLTKLDSRVNTVVMMGMGGELIAELLENTFKLHPNVTKYILEPNNREMHLREFLINNGFDIVDEVMVFEGHFYEILVCVKANKVINYSSSDFMFGKILKQKRSDEFIDKWTRQYNINKEIIKNNPKVVDSLKKIIKENEMIEEILWQK